MDIISVLLLSKSDFRSIFIFISIILLIVYFILQFNNIQTNYLLYYEYFLLLVFSYYIILDLLDNYKKYKSRDENIFFEKLFIYVPIVILFNFFLVYSTIKGL